MTRQYKNPFEDPEAEFYGKKVKDYKFSERKEAPLGNKAPDLEGYIYVPKIKLYVAKEKTLHGKDWYDAHKELHEQGLQMLTPRQFIDFVLYLEKNPSVQDTTKILDEILTTSVRDHWRGEWLDAYFTKEERLMTGGTTIKAAARPGGIFWPTDELATGRTGELYIHYNHRIENDELVAKNIEPLEKCLMKDEDNCHIDLKSCNKQGLPTKEYSGEGIVYRPPKEGKVVRFDADRYKAWLDCKIRPEFSDLKMGVRAAFKKEEKKTK